MKTNLIYNMDCIDGMKKYIPDNSIDLVVTSPPYNLGVKYDKFVDWMTWDEYYNWCRTWLREVYRVLKPDGRFCLNHYISCGTAEHRSAPLMNLNAICEFEIGFKHNAFALWTESSTVKRTAWGSWCSSSAPYINCLASDTIIITEKGLKPISEITKKDKVMSHKGRFRRVLQNQKKVHYGDVIEITPHYNICKPIVATTDHQFLVKERTVIEKYSPTHHMEYKYSEKKWVTADEIEKRTYKIKNQRRKEVRFYLASPKNKKEILPNAKCDFNIDNTNFWEFVGFWLAEGCIDTPGKIGNYRIRVSGHINEFGYIDNLLKECGFNATSYISKRAKSVTFSIMKKSLYNFLSQFYIEYALEKRGTKSHLKMIPEWCINLPKKYCMALIKGYLTGDGVSWTKRNTPVYSIDSTSYISLVQIQRLLLKCGYYATLYSARESGKQTFPGNKTHKIKRQHRITWFDNKTRYKEVFGDCDYDWLPIKGVKRKSNIHIDVCDLTVDIDHTFCIPCTVTHNSPHEGIDILYKDHWKKDKKGESTITKKEFMESTLGIWNIPPEKKRDGCPAPFPKGLPRRCINLFTYKGDIVVDPFNGGGTTCIVAKETGRQYIGFDISEHYCKIAEIELNKT